MAVALAAAIACAIAGPARAQTVDPRSLHRVFLVDGRALPSYGEPTNLPGRLAFVLVIGDPRGKFELQLVSLPSARIDAARTQRYVEFLRTQQYGITGGPADYSALAAEINLALSEIDKQADPKKKLDQALEARRRIAEWPAAHRFYRLADVRAMLAGLDALLPDLASAAGATLPAARALPDPPPYEPEPALPGPNDWVAVALAAAASSDDNGRTAILRSALVVAGAAESAAPIRAELVRLGVPVPPAAAAAAPPPAPASARPTVTPPAPPSAPVPAPTVVVATNPPAPPPGQAPKSESTPAPSPAAAAVAPLVEPLTPLADSSRPRRTPTMAVIAVSLLGAAAMFVMFRRRPRRAPRELADETPASEVPALVVPAPVVSAPAVTAPVVSAPVAPAPLELIRVSDTHDHGYCAVEGEVKNVSSQMLADLRVAIHWYVPEGALLTSDEALLAAEALPAGRTVAFRVLTRSLPGMARYSLEFRSAGHLVAEFHTINP